jgi:hypothetical protein
MACSPLSGNQVDTGHDTDSAKLRAVLAFDDVRPAPLKCEVLESRQAALLDRLVDADVVRQSVALVAGNVQRPTFVFIDELKRTTATGNSDVSDKICLEDGDILKGRRQARVFKVRVWTSKSDSTVCSVQFVYEHSQSGNVDYFDGAMHGKVPTDIGRPTHCLNLSADECITALSLFWDQSRTPATLAALRIKTNAGQQLTAGSAPETMDLTPKSKTSSWQVVVVPNQHAVKGFFSFVDGDGELRSVGALTHSFKQFNLDSSTSTTNNMLTFVHSTDFDENGLMYWFGTKGKTVVWQNPHTLGDVTVTCSNIKQDSSPVSVRTSVIFYLINLFFFQ